MSLNLEMVVRAVALDANATRPEADAKIERFWIKELIALIGTCVGVVLIAAVALLLYLA